MRWFHSPSSGSPSPASTRIPSCCCRPDFRDRLPRNPLQAGPSATRDECLRHPDARPGQHHDAAAGVAVDTECSCRDEERASLAERALGPGCRLSGGLGPPVKARCEIVVSGRRATGQEGAGAHHPRGFSGASTRTRPGARPHPRKGGGKAQRRPYAAFVRTMGNWPWIRFEWPPRARARLPPTCRRQPFRRGGA